MELFQTATEITGAQWPEAKTFSSPCPTLKVISAVSQQMIAREELKRMADRPGFERDGTPIRITKRKKVALVADKIVVQGFLRNTVGRVGRLAGRLLLGRVPENAKQGSFQVEKPLVDIPGPNAESVPEVEDAGLTSEFTTGSSRYIDVINDLDKAALEEEIFDQVFTASGKASKSEAGEVEEKVIGSV